MHLVTQSESAECGLACLCMVASYHGINYSLNELRRSFSISTRGSNLVNLVGIAEKIGLAGRPLQLELEEIPQLSTPCILHWEFNHFVVLTRATPTYVEIYDPAHGKRRLSYKRVSESFTGVAMEFTRTAELRGRGKVQRVRVTDLWGSVSGLGFYAFQLAMLAVVAQLVATIGPIITQVIIDRAISRGDANLVIILSIGALAVLLIQIALTYLQATVGLHLGTQLALQMKTNLLRHALNLPISWFERRHMGDILQKFSSLDNVQRFITSSPAMLVMYSVTAVIALTLMFAYHKSLAIMVLAIFVASFTLRALYFPAVRRLTDEGMSFGARANTALMETIRGARTFKQYNKEQERVIIWQNQQISGLNSNVAIAKLTLMGQSGLRLISGLQTVLIWSIGAHAVMKGDLTLGMLLAFQGFAFQFSGAISGLTTVHFNWKTLGVHLERLADLVHEDADPDAVDTTAEGGRQLEGGLALRSASFRFSLQEPYVFENVNLDIKPGEFVAIVGRTGGGKTTLLKTLAALTPLSSGELYIDGVPAAGFGVRNYRQQIGAVLQDDRLFQGTISENVAFFDPQIDPAKVKAALEAACLFDEVEEMPMQLQTLVGEMGASLSAGQIQRVLIARALYRSPKIIFLDEGTSNLDPGTERRLTEGLKRLRITRIHVSHREQASQGADRLIRVEGGRIVENKVVAS